MSMNITYLRRRSVAAVVAGAAALLVGAGAYSFSASASASQEGRPALADTIDYGALQNQNNASGADQANQYQRGCETATYCER
ncbi:hypothetical protein [Streptomyces sp. SD31]|uniref:hypothetical protein n=1 Tax=Streptomyces sp. SD31 TaxID=3452208 RepID=UPI003F8CC99C